MPVYAIPCPLCINSTAQIEIQKQNETSTTFCKIIQYILLQNNLVYNKTVLTLIELLIY